ncbi:hypothetical protein P245_14480 [Comamonas thiooxydans]|uniref:Uncharacterized protein n=1 Tax=Comamonas thiooxydans TaxID=363952 RepID=A0A0E3BDD0_9BURK|nr:hypothetical protein P245_14480 [Comamonas thiooxydans]
MERLKFHFRTIIQYSELKMAILHIKTSVIFLNITRLDMLL